MKSLIGILKIIVFIAGFMACNMSKKNQIQLPGKILVERDDRFYIYNNSSKSKKSSLLIDEKGIRFCGLRWFYGEVCDSLIGLEYIKPPGGGTTQSNIVILDLDGKLIRRVYEVEHDIVNSVFLSPKNNKLLFSVERSRDYKKFPFEGLLRSQSLIVMDFKSNRIVTRIDSLGNSSTLEIDESPWLPNEDKFIYTISINKNIIFEGNLIDTTIHERPGIYLYNISTKTKTLLIENGRHGVVSPLNNSIAYMLGGAVWIKNLDSNIETQIFRIKKKQHVSKLHWTPDGNRLFLFTYDKSSKKFGEMLINIESRSEESFESIDHGYYHFSWK